MTEKFLIFKILIGLFLLTNSYAQEQPEIIAERIANCNSNFPDNLISRLKNELDELERYFIQNGLLDDNSSESFYAVYDQIADENDLTFKIDTTFFLLDSLDIQLAHKCFYKLLTPHQISQLTNRHLKAAKKITKNYQGNITPGKIARRIVDNLMVEDFELEFYRLSSLLLFYEIASPSENQLLFPQYNVDQKFKENNTLTIKLNKDSQILIQDQLKTPQQLEEIILTFLHDGIKDKAVKIISSKEASYDSYMNLLKCVNKPIDGLRNELANQEFKTNYSELTYDQKNQINERIPKNIIINEPY